MDAVTRQRTPAAIRGTCSQSVSGVSGFIASTPQPAAFTAVCSSPGPTPVTTITLTQTGVKWRHKLTALTGPGTRMSVMRWFKFAHGCDSRLIRSDHSRRGICY